MIGCRTSCAVYKLAPHANLKPRVPTVAHCGVTRRSQVTRAAAHLLGSRHASCRSVASFRPATKRRTPVCRGSALQIIGDAAVEVETQDHIVEGAERLTIKMGESTVRTPHTEIQHSKSENNMVPMKMYCDILPKSSLWDRLFNLQAVRPR